MKIVNSILCVLFLAFAYIQHDAINSMIWITLCLFVALISALATMNIFVKPLLFIGIITCAGGLIYLLPHFITWISNGLESILKAQTENSYIQLTRLFFGLLISLFTLGFHWQQANNNIYETINPK